MLCNTLNKNKKVIIIDRLTYYVLSMEFAVVIVVVWELTKVEEERGEKIVWKKKKGRPRQFVMYVHMRAYSIGVTTLQLLEANRRT